MAVESLQAVSFHPQLLSPLIKEGHAAYQALYVAVMMSMAGRGMPDPYSSQPPLLSDREEQQGAIFSRMPKPDALPGLRELVLLARSATNGELEIFYHEPRKDGRPVSAPLRRWLARRARDFDELFPGGPASLVDVVAPADLDALGQAMLRGTELAAHYGREAAPEHVAFVLVRDQALQLAPFLTQLDAEPDPFIAALLEDAREPSPPDPEWPARLAAEVETVAAELDGPAGAEAVLVALSRVAGTRALAQLVEEAGGDRALRAAAAGTVAEAARTHVLNVQPRAVPDLPSAEDVIGVAPLVDGLEALLNDPKTTLPLAVAVNAPWGAGKSSMMLQLRTRLQGAKGPRTWTTVGFDAWKYEKSERLWAALAKAVYEQPVARMTWWARLSFRIRLERRRLGAWAFWARTVAPVVLAGIAAVVVLATGASAAAVASATTIAGFLGLAGVARLLGLVTDPFKRAIDQYAERGARYADKLGFTAEADDDVAMLTELLTGDEGQALAIFVDDLDRCSPTHVVEVVEAVNQIFNSTGGRPCLFVLGMDRDVVAASIRAAYAELIVALEPQSPALACDFGDRFLAKLVQLSVAVPPPAMAGMERLLIDITGNHRPDRAATADGAPSREQVAIARGAIEAEHPRNPAEVAEAAGKVSDALTPAAVDEAMRQARAERFNADSEDVAAAEFELLEHLPRNPRDVKRFDNAFRLQLHVANGTPGCRLSFAPPQLFALGKWVALRLRWPDLARQFDARPELIAAVETEANGGPAADGFAWPADRASLVALLREDDEARRLAPLPFATFLHAL
jgi:KAP-like P-loop domain-containing protein